MRNFILAWDLARRDLIAKYRRSIIGSAWLVLTPLCLLGIYSLIFGRIFGVTWEPPMAHGGVSAGFVLPFFVGLSIYLFLSDIVNSSTVLFVSKRTFVVKSPFPIWVLWVSNLFRATVHAIVLLVLLLGLAFLQQRVSVTGIAWFFLGVGLCAVFLCALSLLLAALGPFIGDISEAMRLLLRVLFYATPITYPLTMVPTAFRDWMWLNPLTVMVELLRAPLVFGHMAPLGVMSGFALVSVLLLCLATWVFSRVKGVISDVV
ncbi:MAG: ABC transporter permease [Methyloversatilis sp.]|nr:ABC transporter permease [Methyloversatilis sp.]